MVRPLGTGIQVLLVRSFQWGSSFKKVFDLDPIQRYFEKIAQYFIFEGKIVPKKNSVWSILLKWFIYLMVGKKSEMAYF